MAKFSRCAHFWTNLSRICATRRRKNGEEIRVLKGGWGEEISIFGQNIYHWSTHSHLNHTHSTRCTSLMGVLKRVDGAPPTLKNPGGIYRSIRNYSDLTTNMGPTAEPHCPISLSWYEVWLTASRCGGLTQTSHQKAEMLPKMLARWTVNLQR